MSKSEVNSKLSSKFKQITNNFRADQIKERLLSSEQLDEDFEDNLANEEQLQNYQDEMNIEDQTTNNGPQADDMSHQYLIPQEEIRKNLSVGKSSDFLSHNNEEAK